jgi:hypothetical protein
MLWANLGLAADWSVVPSVTARTEFNSNLAYSFTQKVSDVIFAVRPAVDVNYATEVSLLQAHLGLNGLAYVKNANLDHIDQNYQVNGQYRVAPRWNLSLRSAYIVDTTLTEELLVSGLVMSRTPRQSIQVGPAVTYNVTERLAATFNYNFNRVNYQDPQFRDYTYQVAGLRLDYPLKNEKTVAVANFLVRETRFPGTDKYRSIGIYAGGVHRFTENWDVNLFAGANISFLNFSTVVVATPTTFAVVPTPTKFKSTEVNPYFNIFTTRRWTNLSLTAGFLRDESPTAFSSISEQNRIYGSASYNFSEKLAAGLNGYYSLTTQTSQGNNLKNDYFSIGPEVRYRVTEKLSLLPGYRFGLRNDLTGNRSATVHAVWLMATYEFPIHFQR